MRSATATALPTEQALVERARAMIPMLRAAGPGHDDAKRISDQVAGALREAGFFRICQSTENGGYGMRPSVLWRVSREVARGDSATAWILSLAGLHPWMAGMFPVPAQDEVFAGGRDAVVIALTGNVGRGVAVRRDGDHFVLDGKWTYASGIDSADWAAVLVEAPTADAAQREMRLMLVPKASFRIDHASWNVFGMRGTGSKDVYLSGERVPGHRTLSWAGLQQGRVPGTARNQGPMYRIPHTSLFVMSVAAAVAGVAHGLLDIHLETVRQRIPAGLNQPQTEDRFSLAELGKGAIRIDTAFQRLIHDVDEMWDRAVAGKPFTVEDRARYRMAGTLICDIALDASDDLVRNLGGSLLPLGPLERCYRDLHAMAAHFLMQANPAAELYGRALLGLPMPPNARY